MPNYKSQLQSNNEALNSNNIDLQSLINQATALPDAGGIDLPELTNEGSASDLLSGKQLINGDGAVVTGTIQTKTASNLTVSGAVVTIPSGYYATQATKSVTTVAQATPSISVNSSGIITASATQTAGYVAEGTKSSTHQLAFQPAKTITPSTTSQIAVSSGYYTGGNITVAGDSNLVASNIKSGVSIFGVSGTLEEGSGESGEQVEWSENEDAIVTKTLSAYFNDRVKTIGSYTFTQCSSLTTVSFPACTTIGSYAFASCIRLKTVSSPVCATIGNDAFLSCRSLATVSFPACTTIGSYAFSNCSRLATVSFPVCTTIGSTAFAQCRSLTTVSFPACTTISSYAFSSCSSLTTVSFPVCTTIGGNVFAGCSSLTTVSFPVCTTISSYAFARCSSLKTVNFPACTTIGGNAFASCRLLSQLYLGASSVCTLSNSNAFYSTPYTGYSSFFLGTPYIYVPSSLVDAYKSTTNWTYFSSYISGI